MLKLYDNGIYLVHGETICSCPEEAAQKSGITTTKEEAAKGTMAYGILKAHNQSDDMDQLRLKFDSMTSHDITYVGIIQTARASGMKRFPLPYVLTNCHNSLCAVGGTINEDDHKFALSAAHKYGGIYVPTNMANIHSYNRETMAGGGRMILGSDSHTRYGALGTMAVGEGGGELAKQLVGRTYDFARPGVIAIYLTGKRTFDNICAAADILRGKSCGNGVFTLSIYPGSMPALAELYKNGRASDLVNAGAIMRECFCGPCFGAGDCPANGEFSVRHTTRNFPNREGSKPGEGQMSSVALMDARSIAATAANGGKLTAATDLDVEYTNPEYHYNASLYEKRVYNGWGKAEPDAELRFGPNIKDWPEMPALTNDLLVKVCSYITDPVTTTDELIPSGETSSYRSNPERLSEFALSRRDPQYVGRSKVMRQIERDREAGKALPEEVMKVYEALTKAGIANDPANTDIGSTIFANMPGDGSAREQAASCQRVMGASANFAKQYATKRFACIGDTLPRGEPRGLRAGRLHLCPEHPRGCSGEQGKLLCLRCQAGRHRHRVPCLHRCADRG